MKNFWNKSWFIKIVSLLIAILLVIYIDSTQPGFLPQGENDKTQEMASESRTIKVPLQVSVNTDKYYVVGYPEKVSITLSGPNALVTSAVNTQNFRAYIDLTNKKIGRHTVKIHISGLNKQVAYSLSPKKIKIDIAQRKSITMPVQIEYNKAAVSEGYNVGRLSVDPDKVEVTGARSEVDQVDQIVAKVVLPNGIKDNYHRQVALFAQDKRGRQLNVLLNPATVSVNVPISLSKKTLKIVLKPKNEVTDKVYSLSTKTKRVTLYGSDAALTKIKKLPVDVDLKGIVSAKHQQVALRLPKGIVKADPENIVVKIQAKTANNNSKKID